MGLLDNITYYYIVYTGLFIVYFLVAYFLDNLHSGDQEPGSLLFTKDEAPANRFVFGYAMAQYPLALILVYGFVAIFSLIAYIGPLIWYLIVRLFSGDYQIVDFEWYFTTIVEYVNPWQIGGFGLYEVIGSFLAGYVIGNYLEEVTKKQYFTTLAVFFTFNSGHLAVIAGYDDIRNFPLEIRPDFLTFLVAINLVLMLAGTFYGNRRRIKSISEELPVVSNYLQVIYFLLLVTLLFVANLLYGENIQSLLEFNVENPIYIISTVFGLYGCFALLRGDVSRKDEGEYYGDPIDINEVELDDEEPRSKFARVIIFLVFAWSFVLPWLDW